MNNKQYSIGEFAAINKVSTRMLRHYDKIGLLKPSTVAENGYRMYSSAQIATATLIKKYRTCAFSLNEISLLIDADSNVLQLTPAKGGLAQGRFVTTLRIVTHAEISCI